MKKAVKKNSEKIKSFRDLITEVQEKGICGKCGGCVSFCSAGELNALGLGKDGSPKFIDENKCLECGICYLICPQIKVLNPELKERFGWCAPIGGFRYIASARARDKRILKVATDGGVVTSLLVYALKKNIIQGALVSKKIGPFKREPVLVTKPEEIIDAAGSYFEESYHVEDIGEKYSTYSAEIIEISNLGKRQMDNIVMVGTPCQIYTVKKMQLLNILPADMITFTIGLFCMENFSFDDAARKQLEQHIKLKLKEIAKLNIKDDVIVTLKNKKTVHLPFELIDQVARPACFACPDFANDYADISVGGLGSPDGYTTTILRTASGERVYNGAKQSRFIEELKYKNREDEVIHRTQIMAKLTAFTKRKKERANRTLAKAGIHA